MSRWLPWRRPIRHLLTRFLLASGLLMIVTLLSGLWSVLTFYRLSSVVDRTVEDTQPFLDLVAELADSLEREDDALLLRLDQPPGTGAAPRHDDRERSDHLLEQIQRRLATHWPAELALGVELAVEIAAYRAAGEQLLQGTDGGTFAFYHRVVNPRLRDATAACQGLRELHLRSMQQAAVSAADQASQAARLVALLVFVVFVVGAASTYWLASSILRPIRHLTRSMEAIRQNQFEQRVKVESPDELGVLAQGFNRMADSLAEYRRSSLGELLATKRTLQSTLDALPDPVLVFAPDGQLQEMNPPARRLLPPPIWTLGCKLAALPWRAEDRERIATALRGQETLWQPPNFRQAWTLPQGEQRRQYLLRAVPIPNFSGDSSGAIVVLDDITEFLRLDDLRMELIGMMSHELKSPLTTLKMNLMMLAERPGVTTEQAGELLGSAIEGCEELGDTIDEFLDMSRIEAGQLRLDFATTNLSSIAQVAIDRLRPRFDDARVDCRLIYNRDIAPLVSGDPRRLTGVMTNLLSNALKYSPRDSSIEVQILSRQNAQVGHVTEWQIEVLDRGPGVPEEFRERVFEKFFRVEHHRVSAMGQSRGTGIGLYFCRKILAAHGGSVCCLARPDGGGANFQVVLPAIGERSE